MTSLEVGPTFVLQRKGKQELLPARVNQDEFASTSSNFKANISLLEACQ